MLRRRNRPREEERKSVGHAAAGRTADGGTGPGVESGGVVARSRRAGEGEMRPRRGLRTEKNLMEEAGG